MTIRTVVSVERISRWLSALMVKGPRGSYFVVEVDPASVKREELRIGQQMVGTYTEAVAMSIEPAAKKWEGGRIVHLRVGVFGPCVVLRVITQRSTHENVRFRIATGLCFQPRPCTRPRRYGSC